jgi:hypothetical protein
MEHRRSLIITEPEAEFLLQSRLSELKRLEQIEKLTNQLNILLTSFYEEISKIQLGTDSVSKITTNWIQIVRAVSLAANSMMIYNESDFRDSTPTTERLVRCALDDLGTIVSQLKDEN